MKTVQVISWLAATALSAIFADSELTAVKPFRPILETKAQFEVYETPISVHASSDFSNAQFSNTVSDDGNVKSIAAIAVSFLSTKYMIPASSAKVTDAYTDTATGITHVYMAQAIGGVNIVNAVANVNIDRNSRIISSSHSFAPLSAIDEASSSVEDHLEIRASDDLETAMAALSILAAHIGTPLTEDDAELASISASASVMDGSSVMSLEGLPTELSLNGRAKTTKAFIQQSTGEITPVWTVNIEQQNHWWNAHVDVASQEVVSLSDWYSSSESYYVYPSNVLSPEDGPRKLVVDPADKKASPKGWVAKDTTVGNNVWAQANPTGGATWKNNYRPKAAAGNVFNYTIDLAKAPKSYIDAAITQLFYSVNIMHDLSYIYGFDEAAGNFQDENYSGKGASKDAVVAFAQDGSGTDNANFATPPDGENGVMRMYIWDITNPNRDGDLEQDIVAHEYTHGISNRLTGGPSNTECLNDGEPGGMGEGWSDAVSYILRLNSTHTNKTDFALGSYVYRKGIRKYPYSTSKTANPSTFEYLDKPGYQEVHAIGEVWAEILYEVLWALVDKNGFAEDIFARDLTKGNTIMLQILLDGMKLQPCNPSFINARDAIIQAEQNLTGGKNKCAIWAAFAKRGLGVKATGADGSQHIEDSTLPSDCQAC
ncbi:hypothetical protein GGI12_002434 [Dipsacomyces acuminosporus]|nr:hypothetical protein GGI12_002434 [Dipsacomyces acuminosporus]